MKQTNVVVIGAGISGVTCAIYLKRSNIDFVLLENNTIGGKLNKLERIENYPSFPSVSGSELANKLEGQLKDNNINITFSNVQTILKDPYGFKVVTSDEEILAKSVVVASGIPLPKANIKGEKEFFGSGVSYCATCDGNFYKGLYTAVYGNRNVVLEESLYLSNLCKKVYLVVNGDTLEGDADLLKAVEEKDNIEIRYNNLVEIKGDMLGVTSIVLDSDEEIEVSGVFPYVGEKSSLDFLKSLNPNYDKNFLVTDEDMMTSIDGLFAIGDIRVKKVRQLVTAASDGAIVASSLVKYLKD